MVVLFNMNKVAYDFYHTHTNPKLYEYEECIVDKIISDNLLLTKHKCSIVYNNKGDYFIGKPFDSDEEIFSGISNIEKNISIIDYDTFENLNLNYDNKNYIHGEYLFHPGLIINSPNDTVIRMKLTKINSMTSYIRILFGTDMNNYNYRKSNKNTDIELIIYSQTGVMIKKVNDVNNKNIQFYDTQLRTLFNDAIHIDLILKNNAIYFSTSDDNMETSIKIKYPLDSGDVIKYIYFDIKESDNAKIKDIEKFNLVENQFLLDIFVFEKKLTLSEDAYWIEELKDGDYCDAIDSNRKTIVEYRCDKTGNSDISISSVTENNTCQYKYNVVSRHFCNPLHLMKYQIDAAVTITKCVAINNIYNFKSEDYFRGVDLQ